MYEWRSTLLQYQSSEVELNPVKQKLLRLISLDNLLASALNESGMPASEWTDLTLDRATSLSLSRYQDHIFITFSVWRAGILSNMQHSGIERGGRKTGQRAESLD